MAIAIREPVSSSIWASVGQTHTAAETSNDEDDEHSKGNHEKNRQARLVWHPSNPCFRQQVIEPRILEPNLEQGNYFQTAAVVPGAGQICSAHNEHARFA